MGQVFTVVAEDEVAAASAVDMDVLDTLNREQVPERTQSAMHDVKALADLPILDLGEAGQRAVPGRRRVIATDCCVGKREDGLVVLRPGLWRTALAQQLVESSPEIGPDQILCPAHMVLRCDLLQHVTPPRCWSARAWLRA